MVKNWITLAGVVVIMLLMSVRGFAQDAKVVEFANAIAKAEGYGRAGTIPTVCHNPGDLKGTKFDGQVGVCKGGHARFKNDSYGWAALYNQIDRMISGNSRVYHVSMTFAQASKLYAGNSKVWLRNVCHEMAIDPDTTFMAYFDLNRQSYTTELETESWDWRAL